MVPSSQHPVLFKMMQSSITKFANHLLQFQRKFIIQTPPGLHIPDFTDGVSIAYWATNVEVPVEAVEGVPEVLNEDGTVETAAVEAVPAKTYTYTLQKTFNRPAWNTIAYPEAE